MRDTTEVDFNVSRHLDFELVAKDWSVLVSFCSYLGAFTCVIPCGLIMLYLIPTMQFLCPTNIVVIRYKHLFISLFSSILQFLVKSTE